MSYSIQYDGNSENVQLAYCNKLDCKKLNMQLTLSLFLAIHLQQTIAYKQIFYHNCSSEPLGFSRFNILSWSLLSQYTKSLVLCYIFSWPLQYLLDNDMVHCITTAGSLQLYRRITTHSFGAKIKKIKRCLSVS